MRRQPLSGWRVGAAFTTAWCVGLMSVVLGTGGCKAAIGTFPTAGNSTSGTGGTAGNSTNGTVGDSGCAACCEPDAGFFGALFQAECATALDQCPVAQIQSASLAAACPALAVATYATEDAELLASVDAGRMAFDCAAAAACVAGVGPLFADAGLCADLDPYNPGAVFDVMSLCPGVFAGLEPVGGACSNDFDCTVGYCSNGEDLAGGGSVWGTGVACMGSCTAYVEDGGSCASDGAAWTTTLCAPGLECIEDPTLPTPICEPPPVPTWGFSSTPCGDGGCPPPLGLGASCDSLFDCALPLVCAGLSGYSADADGGSPNGHCAPGNDVGGSCQPNPAGTSGCLAGLGCVDGACVLPPASGPCLPETSLWPFGMVCALNSYCDYPSNSCQPLSPLGASCPSDQETCAAGFCDSQSQCALTECVSSDAGSGPLESVCQLVPACPAGATANAPCQTPDSEAFCGTTGCACGLRCSQPTSDGGWLWQVVCP